MALLALLLLVGGAFRHALVLRNGIMHRMLPWQRRRKP
jgi:hypothetical protein